MSLHPWLGSILRHIATTTLLKYEVVVVTSTVTTTSHHCCLGYVETSTLSLPLHCVPTTTGTASLLPLLSHPATALLLGSLPLCRYFYVKVVATALLLPLRRLHRCYPYEVSTDVPLAS